MTVALYRRAVCHTLLIKRRLLCILPQQARGCWTYVWLQTSSFLCTVTLLRSNKPEQTVVHSADCKLRRAAAISEEASSTGCKSSVGTYSISTTGAGSGPVGRRAVGACNKR